MTAGAQTPDTSPLPLDSDIEVDDARTSAPRPVHLHWRYLGLVALGGMIGTGLREALSLAIPPIAGIPFTTAAINIIGAFVLGFLLETLAHRGEDAGRRRVLRLFAGTGILGGFTTYSALATDTVLLLQDTPAVGLAYAVGTLLIGGAATAGGIITAGAIRRKDAR